MREGSAEGLELFDVVLLAFLTLLSSVFWGIKLHNKVSVYIMASNVSK